MKNKLGLTTAKALEEGFKGMKKYGSGWRSYTKYLITDNGLEYVASHTQKMLKNLNIKHIITKTPRKSVKILSV